MPVQLAAPVGADDHIRGPVTARVTVVEYGHYQCAGCAALRPHLLDLLRQRAPLIRLVYRHFPLPLSDLYPYKVIAAEVAEAAAVRGRFWAMHDWLLSHQYEIDHSSLRRAELLFDLPPEAVELEISEHRYDERIMRDHAGGLRSGVSRTPTLFVNGERLDSGPTVDDVVSDLIPVLDRSVGATNR